MLAKTKLSTRIVLQSVIIIMSFVLALGWLHYHLKGKLYDEKIRATKHVVDVAYSTLIQYDDRVKKGELQVEEAQKRAALDVQNLRYAEKEYFWINDLVPRMIMHPYKPELNGKDLSEEKDPNGKRLFVEFVNVCKEKGEGLVEYMWPKQGETKPAPKISYVKLFKPWGWIVGSGIYVDDLHKEFAKIFYVILGVILVIGIGGLVCSMMMTRSITKPLNNVINGLNMASDEIRSASAQVSSSSQRLAEDASEQAAAVEETSSSIEEISSMVNRNADNANQAKALTEHARQIVGNVGNLMNDMSQSVEEITKSSSDTVKIIKTIDEIAFQTNLLALNAAVEAARAGEAGAGFAVVADEVRRLAMRASEAANNTSTLIDGTIKSVQKGNELTKKTKEAFQENMNIVGKIGDLVGKIAAASNEQSHGIAQINKAIAEIDKVTQSTAASAEESASASEELSAQAQQMKEYVENLVVVIKGTTSSVQAELSLQEHHVAESNSLNGQRNLTKARAAQKVSTTDKLYKTTLQPVKGKVVAIAGKARPIKTDHVIPLEEGQFKDF